MILVAVGCLALLTGLLVYLADRTASHAVLIPDLALSGGRHWFGTLGQWLPSAVHALAFSLFTAAVLKPGVAARWAACTLWAVVNVAFELGQHPTFRPRWTAALQGEMGDWVVTRSALNYFLHGTFDTYDIGAAILGALAAGAFLHFVDHVLEAHHAPH